MLTTVSPSSRVLSMTMVSASMDSTGRYGLESFPEGRAAKDSADADH